MERNNKMRTNLIFLILIGIAVSYSIVSIFTFDVNINESSALYLGDKYVAFFEMDVVDCQTIADRLTIELNEPFKCK